MDLRKLKTLIELVENSGIAELELTEGEEHVRISRHSSVAAPLQQYYAAAPQAAPAAAPAAPARRSPAAAAPLRLKHVQVWESDTASVIYYE